MARIIGVISGKGGVGKTTIVSNLGVIMSSVFRRNVTIIDCNVTNSHLALHLGMNYLPVTLNSVLKKEAKIDSAVYDHHSGVKVIPASLNALDLEGVDMFNLKGALKPVFKRTDIIILDSAPGLGREASAVLKAADELMFVTIPILPSVIDIVRCQEVLNRMGQKPMGIIVNMAGKSRRELSKLDIESFTNLKVLSTIPNDNRVYESTFAGTPVYMLNKNAGAAVELAKLAAYLTGTEYKENSFFKILRRLRLY